MGDYLHQFPALHVIAAFLAGYAVAEMDARRSSKASRHPVASDGEVQRSETTEHSQSLSGKDVG